jgi:predicted GH43/DUF377 family glycosyl hydrolase
MPKKSVFAQMEVCAVPPHGLLPSPRYQNPGLLRFGGKLWLAYRYHRMETPTKRSGIGIVEIDAATGNAVGKSQHLPLANPTGNEHHEDCRLFVFRGEPYISYTEMVGYIPGVNYTCIMEYARLSLKRGKWSVEQEWTPQYGNNNGFAKEKNWVFFEHDKKLHCIYGTDPEHVVLELDGSKVVREYRTKGPSWHWGHVRGGTPPVDLGDGRLLAIFHSSLPTEEPPHYVRYYAAAYTFESKPPFRILQISEQPILAGSEEDGHRTDPRYTEGWKPYVVFPCGLVPDGKDWLLSFGINDWQCAVGRLRADQLLLGAPDGSTYQPRYFRTDNGTRPIRYIDAHQRPVFIRWEVIRTRRGVSAGDGYFKATNPREAVEISEQPGVTEIPQAEFERAMKRRDVVFA